MEAKPAETVMGLLNAYRLSIGFGIPVAILIIGIVGKKWRGALDGRKKISTLDQN